MLILGFDFPISPRRLCCSGSQGNSQFFSPINEVGIDEGSALVVYKRLWNSERMYPFLNSRDSSLSSSVRKWVYDLETRKCIINQKTRNVTWGVKSSFVINMDYSERNSFVLSLFQWYFISVFRLRLIVKASQTISSECTYPVKHARPVVESFCNSVSF